MWMMVLFDLPVIEKQERKEAAKFRKFLLEEGFSMSGNGKVFLPTHGKNFNQRAVSSF